MKRCRCNSYGLMWRSCTSTGASKETEIQMTRRVLLARELYVGRGEGWRGLGPSGRSQYEQTAIAASNTQRAFFLPLVGPSETNEFACRESGFGLLADV